MSIRRCIARLSLNKEINKEEWQLQLNPSPAEIRFARRQGHIILTFDINVSGNQINHIWKSSDSGLPAAILTKFSNKDI